MQHYCTLFNSIYLTRGLALYESLVATKAQFHLYIFAFDQLSYDVLTQLKLSNATIISLQDFEDSDLLKIKPTRSIAEYCWTCTPSVIKYSIETFNLPACTYLDADLYFFKDPIEVIDEMQSKEVSIISHRFTPRYDQTKEVGTYCVQFMTFKNSRCGMEVLNWWRNACIEWCFAICEEERYGDQKYLNKWPQTFPCIHEVEHLGAGLAPWNIQQYNFSLKNNFLIGTEIKSNKTFDAIFYHFHDFKYLENHYFDLGFYRLEPEVRKYIYKTYMLHLEKIEQNLNTLFANNVFHEIKKFPSGFEGAIKFLKGKLKGTYNIYTSNNI